MRKTTESKTAKKSTAKAAETAVEAKEVTKSSVASAATKVVGETAKAAGKAVEAVAKKAEEIKKEVEKAPAKRATGKKAVSEKVYVQYLGKEIDKDELVKQVKEIWTAQLKQKAGDMKSLALYVKPEENKVYYVINEDVTGSIDL